MSAKLFVGQLPADVTSEELREIFSECGQIMDCIVYEGRGFGFVTYSYEEEAAAAVEKFNGTEIKGNTIKVGMANEHR